jgi:hypothetical protein
MTFVRRFSAGCKLDARLHVDGDLDDDDDFLGKIDSVCSYYQSTMQGSTSLSFRFF